MRQTPAVPSPPLRLERSAESTAASHSAGLSIIAMTSDPAGKLSQILRLILDLPDDADTSTLRRINESKWDSLANVTLVTALESEFGLSLDAQEIERLTSYKSTLLLVRDKLK